MWFSNFETKVILLKLLTRISSSHLFLSNAIYTVDNNPKAPREYTTNLYSKIPMKQLLLFTRGDEQNYGDLYPPLLKYIVTYLSGRGLDGRGRNWIIESCPAQRSEKSYEFDWCRIIVTFWWVHFYSVKMSLCI